MLPPRAYIFIGLNIVRVLSIVACILAFASNVHTLVDDIQAVNKFENGGGTGAAANSTSVNTEHLDYIPGSTVPHQVAGVFWAVLNRLLIIAQIIVLILSEFGWPAKFFDKYFPVLGKDFGLGALGVVQMLIGAAVLSHHVDTFALVSSFFLFAIGCLNVVLGLIFREKVKPRRALTAWKERAKDLTSFLPAPVQQGVRTGVNVASKLDAWPGKHSNGPEETHGFGDGSNRSGEADGHGPKMSFSERGMGFGRQALGNVAGNVAGQAGLKAATLLAKPLGSRSG